MTSQVPREEKLTAGHLPVDSEGDQFFYFNASTMELVTPDTLVPVKNAFGFRRMFLGDKGGALKSIHVLGIGDAQTVIVSKESGTRAYFKFPLWAKVDFPFSITDNLVLALQDMNRYADGRWKQTTMDEIWKEVITTTWILTDYYLAGQSPLMATYNV